MPTQESVPYSNLFTGGDLLQRIERNFDRLESSLYRNPAIFKLGDYEWPGDYEGRTILGLVLLAQSSHRQPRYLAEIMNHLPDYVNAKGYFGAVRSAGSVDEQQLAGNSWVLRAMVEYYQWKHDDLSYQMIQNIVDNLVLPTRGLYAGYPADERSLTQGGLAGHSVGQRGGWVLSTDIGCAFIMLDGATDAYRILPHSRLKSVIEEMVQRFAAINPQVVSMQTHAMLSATRGILRYYEIDGNPELLSIVERTYQLYFQNALTANYANYNWFGRPQWTEACAIIDSFMLAIQLWKHTGCPRYLDDAHKVYFNALCHAQRPTGGFGCDSCVGPAGNVLSPLGAGFEATWCCTMRGGEGLARVAEYAWFVGPSSISLVYYHNGFARIQFGAGQITIRQTSRYPIEGAVRLEIVQTSVPEDITLYLYIPEWVEANQMDLTVNAERRTISVIDHFLGVTRLFQQGDIVDLRFLIPLSVDSTHIGHSFWHGSLMLGAEAPPEEITIPSSETFIPLENGRYRSKQSGVLLEPITDLYLTTTETALTDRRQVLFPVTMVPDT